MLMKNGRYLIKRKIEKFVERCLFSAILLIGLTFTTGFYYERNINMKLEDITIELGEKLPEDITRYVELMRTNNNLTMESNVPLDDEGHTSMIGEFSYYLVYIDDFNKFSKLTNVKSMITVVDTIKPTITIKENSKFKYGSKLEATDVAECFDLSGCEMYFEEEIDTNKSGEYEIKVVAVDGGENTTSSSAKITILEKPKPVFTYRSYSNNYSYMNNQNNQINNRLSEEEKNNLRYQIVEYAKRFIGNPYVYGGTSLTNGTDCSGFTMGVYGNFGYSLPRVATSQGSVGIQVSENQLLPGDIVVYYYNNGGGHVGIYAGNGMMVHAGTAQTGIVLAPMFSGYRTYRRIIY